jgi:hypothetical protein
MCTLSWIRELDGYHVFFNRDERRTRAPGIAPEPGVRGDIRWLAPRDGESHGTWIGANTGGITLAILNRWHESPVATDGPWTSRGLLVRDLLDATSLDEMARRLEATDLRVYQPFTLAAFETGRDVSVFAWTGRAAVRDQVADSGMVLTSSGFDQEAAMRRAELFARYSDPRPEQFEAVHSSHEPERGPLSVCMHRPEAETVSFTRIEVNPARVIMTYAPGAPGETTDRIVSTLDR